MDLKCLRCACSIRHQTEHLCLLCLGLTASQYKHFLSNVPLEHHVVSDKVHLMTRQLCEHMVESKCTSGDLSEIRLYNTADPCFMCCKTVASLFHSRQMETKDLVYFLNLIARWLCIHSMNQDLFTYLPVTFRNKNRH